MNINLFTFNYEEIKEILSVHGFYGFKERTVSTDYGSQNTYYECFKDNEKFNTYDEFELICKYWITDQLKNYGKRNGRDNKNSAS